ncbi:MAG: alpha-E domain-containing protein [Lutimonas sp.]
MLSRVANNLYWMGRYIERAEHIARYSKEIYFSSLDAPILETYDRNFVLDSMLYMTGIFDFEYQKEEEVLYKIGLDPDNSNSILSNITFARENARGARNAISTGLWENLNRFYHLVNDYPVEKYLTTGFYEFSQMVLDQTSILRVKIYDSLLHDEEWAVILLGMYTERVLQVIRIINAKLHDIYKIEQSGIPVTELSFEWTTLLRCTESFDMNRKYYAKTPNSKQVLEFLIVNPNCPRSLAFSLNGIRKYIKKLIRNESSNPNSISFKIGKLNEKYNYLTYDDYKDDIYGLLNDTQEKITTICSEIEKKYLTY